MKYLPGTILILLTLTLPAWAFQATVTAVHDGDTLTLDTGQKVRLWGIDAPETKSRKWAAQPGSEGSRNGLAAMALWQIVEVEQRGRSYDRIVAVVTRAADGLNLSAAMVYDGWAWVEPRYCKKAICGFWREGEESAKAKRAGLWGLGEPVPPWEWRQQPE